jgi:glycosyltransferase involved in cell wall biosynthesis
MKLSLVIPCLNAHKTIRSSLIAATNQTQPFFEIIVVDNNSTDSSVDIVKEFSEVNILTCTKQGPSAARNCGWKKCSGDYVAFVDDDVVLDRNWSLHMHNLFKNRNIIATQSQIIPTFKGDASRWIDRYRTELKKKKTNGTWIELDLSRNITALNTAACIYRKDILLQLNGFEEQLLRLEDTDLALKARYLGDIAPCEQATATVRYSGSVLSYLNRSFINGKSQVLFNYLWRLKSSQSSFEFVVGKYRFFELLCFLMFKLGYIYGLIKTKKTNAKSLRAVQMIQRTKKESIPS